MTLYLPDPPPRRPHLSAAYQARIAAAAERARRPSLSGRFDVSDEDPTTPDGTIVIDDPDAAALSHRKP